MKSTVRIQRDDVLQHHGVKGMHWGEWNAETAARYADGQLSFDSKGNIRRDNEGTKIEQKAAKLEKRLDYNVIKQDKLLRKATKLERKGYRKGLFAPSYEARAKALAKASKAREALEMERDKETFDKAELSKLKFKTERLNRRSERSDEKIVKRYQKNASEKARSDFEFKQSNRQEAAYSNTIHDILTDPQITKSLATLKDLKTRSKSDSSRDYSREINKATEEYRQAVNTASKNMLGAYRNTKISQLRNDWDRVSDNKYANKYVDKYVKTSLNKIISDAADTRLEYELGNKKKNAL